VNLYREKPISKLAFKCNLCRYIVGAGAGGSPAAVTADGDTAAELMATAALDGKRAPTPDARAACERAAAAIAKAAAAAKSRSAKSRSDDKKVAATAGGKGTFASLGRKEQTKRVREWAGVVEEKRTARGVPTAAWRALDVHSKLAKEAELRDFLMKLIDDDDFQGDMREGKVRGAVEDVVGLLCKSNTADPLPAP
jgi:hypothetical protein